MQAGKGQLVRPRRSRSDQHSRNLASLADIQEEAYSNNVGFYNSKIYVLSPGGGTSAELGSKSSNNGGSLPESASPTAAEHKPARSAVNIGKIGISGTRAVAPGSPVKVYATLRAGSVPRTRPPSGSTTAIQTLAAKGSVRSASPIFRPMEPLWWARPSERKPAANRLVHRSEPRHGERSGAASIPSTSPAPRMRNSSTRQRFRRPW